MIAAAERQAQAPAPAFDATDISGHSLKLASLTEKKPLVLFFIESECPCSRDAAPFLDRLNAAYKDACTVVGVINVPGKIADEWAKQVGAHFPIIADPTRSIISSYGAERSAYITTVSPGGNILKTYPGYSQAMLSEIATTIARLDGVPARTIDFDTAPQKTTVGCPFN
jgi:peroxiredoxin